jgi:hypothetical protein
MTENPSTEKKEEIKSTNNKDDKSETGYGKILITALLTAVLTSITQFFLQDSRLSGEQEYWRKRYEIESIDKINAQRLQLVDDINKELLLLEVKAKEIKINVAASKYLADPEETKALTGLMVQYHKDLNLFTAKIQMASLYFGSEVDS